MLRTITVTLAATALLALWIPASASAGDAAAGKPLFDANCSSCHGMTGKGDGPVGAALDPKPRDFSAGDFKLDADKDGKSGTDADLAAIIKQGAGAFGGSPLMAPWPTLSDAEVANVIAYVRSLKQ
ncbi:MAG: cytochrome c [Proteobacteria bacterium]|nr:cytochrome c [Pseudomonadota bacterium]